MKKKGGGGPSLSTGVGEYLFETVWDTPEDWEENKRKASLESEASKCAFQYEVLLILRKLKNKQKKCHECGTNNKSKLSCI